MLLKRARGWAVAARALAIVRADAHLVLVAERPWQVGGRVPDYVFARTRADAVCYRTGDSDDRNRPGATLVVAGLDGDHAGVAVGIGEVVVEPIPLPGLTA